MKNIILTMFALGISALVPVMNAAEKTAPAATPATAPATESTPAPSYHTFILKLLGKDIVALKDAKGSTDSIKTRKYLFIYWSAHWCPPCRAFTPKLVDFYNKNYAANGDFDLVFVSSDKSQSDMDNYMKIEKMPWIGLKLDSKSTTALKQQWVKHGWTGIPNLILLDENDKVIASSYDKAGEYIGPETALKAYAKLRKAQNTK